MNSHKCIKPNCNTVYEDNEIDAFYCPSCDVARKAIAQEIDGKFNTVGQQPSSELAAYDAARNYTDPKTGEHKIAAFPRATSVGIKF